LNITVNFTSRLDIVEGISWLHHVFVQQFIAMNY